MKVTAELKARILALDREYRSTWDAHAIAYIAGLSATTVAKILREFRGPRPKRAKRPHTRRTKFTRRDVMWSSDFMRLGWGWLLLTTMDEHSGYILGWDLVRSEAAFAVLEHAESILERMGRAPLVWKYDHGSAFTSEMFQGLLEEYEIVPYPIAAHSLWVNGRKERDHQEVHQWLIPLAGREMSREALDREIDDEMLVRNFIKPRACLGFRKSAQDCGYAGPPFRWDEGRRFLLRCELDAAFFHLYLPAEKNGDWRPAEGETPEDLARLKAGFPTPRHAVAYIMDTFPIVKRKDEEKFGSYRTKDTILEIYDALSESIRTGRPYLTRLDPPPADPRVRHPERNPATAKRRTAAP